MRDPAANHATRLICFSHLHWNFVFQRPQHLMSRASQAFDVVFFEEPVSSNAEGRRLRIEQPLQRLKVITPEISHSDDGAGIDTFLEESLNDILQSTPAQHTIAWYYTPMMLPFSRHIARNVTVYDCMDELSAFKNAPQELRDLERELLLQSDMVFTGGFSLYQAKRSQHRNVHAFPSSIDVKHFGMAKDQERIEPVDQAGISHPRVGFFGVIDERMDTELVEKLVALRPDIQFVVIGPVVKIDASQLPQAPNLHWLGRKPYTDLPAYLGGWDAGFMPFALNESTRYISPTKTPEFLAAGVPVVSTPIADVVRPYGESNLVEIARTPEEFSASLDRLLTHPRELWAARIKRQLSQSSWDSVWRDMTHLISDKLSGILTPNRTKETHV
jgi:glycosyltransferase involved in cell wall biosynthesis